MYIVGLTGGIGSGKSTVSTWLRSHAPDVVTIVDADAVSREIMSPGSPVLPQLQEVFGADILDEHGELRRSLLAQRAFHDEQHTAQLNAITHPEIRRRVRAKIDEATTPLVILDHPLLIETNADALVDSVLVVTADVEARIARLVHQRGLDEVDVRRRMAQQLSDAQRNSYADELIDNSGTLEELEAQIAQWWDELAQQLGLGASQALS
ncbi:MAG: dephospho-CoA kinase [Corynebacterium sp.]|nr:dephospho-CoA kinase [Corynebacterium sp.]